jgi:hypothetical protein
MIVTRSSWLTCDGRHIYWPNCAPSSKMHLNIARHTLSHPETALHKYPSKQWPRRTVLLPANPFFCYPTSQSAHFAHTWSKTALQPTILTIDYTPRREPHPNHRPERSSHNTSAPCAHDVHRPWMSNHMGHQQLCRNMHSDDGQCM